MLWTEVGKPMLVVVEILISILQISKAFTENRVINWKSSRVHFRVESVENNYQIYVEWKHLRETIISLTSKALIVWLQITTKPYRSQTLANQNRGIVSEIKIFYVILDVARQARMFVAEQLLHFHFTKLIEFWIQAVTQTRVYQKGFREQRKY